MSNEALWEAGAWEAVRLDWERDLLRREDEIEREGGSADDR